MFNLSEIIAQIPINVYVLVGCLVVGWLMKKFLPTDNKIIPLVMVILGAIVYVLLEGSERGKYHHRCVHRRGIHWSASGIQAVCGRKGSGNH